MQPDLQPDEDYVERNFVETTDGSLVLVDGYDHLALLRLISYKVCKLVYSNNDDDSDKQFEFIPIKSLGGNCFFSGEFNQSMSVLASNYPVCTPNTIYYAMIYYAKINHSGRKSNRQFDAFNVGDQRFSLFSLPDGYERSIFFILGGTIHEIVILIFPRNLI